LVAAEPWTVLPAKNATIWNRRLSNVVIGYYVQGLRSDTKKRRKGYDQMKDYRLDTADIASGNIDVKELLLMAKIYGDDGGANYNPFDLARQRLTYDAEGYWAMSRGEIFYDGPRGGGHREDFDHVAAGGFNASGGAFAGINYGTADGPYSPDLWHPTWSARLRPVVLGGGEIPADYDETADDEDAVSMNQIYHATAMSFVLATLLDMSSLSDIYDVVADLAYMDKATIAMGTPGDSNTTMRGVFK
jgi:hypothetical protein